MGHAIALSAHVDAVVVVARLKALRMSTLQDMSRILEASPATKLGFIVTGVDQERALRPASEIRRLGAAGGSRSLGLTLTVPPSVADGDGGVPAGERSVETANEIETEGGGDQPAPSTPAHSRSKPASKPFGGLSPSEAGKRSAEIRRAKSAQRADAPERHRSTRRRTRSRTA